MLTEEQKADELELLRNQVQALQREKVGNMKEMSILKAQTEEMKKLLDQNLDINMRQREKLVQQREEIE